MGAVAKPRGRAKAQAKVGGKRPVGRPKGSGKVIKDKSAKKKTVASSAAKSALFQKGRVDRKVLKSETTMTSEQWKKLQVGMADKWPLPDFLHGQKNGMRFKDETFAQVTCWMAETKIEYRPHAKAPGSKSHLRYERYSKAKTVGEALKFGSYPQDWCWDYERGFLRVKDGPFREEPMDVTKEDDVTDVDRAINTWYVKELAKLLGMKTTELVASVGSGETLHSRAMRLLAQQEASAHLEAADREGRAVTDNEVLLTLKRWPFARNNTRKNVMQPGMKWVFSDTLGMLRDRQGDIHLTAPTRRYPQVAELFNRWLSDRIPAEAKGFAWTSINVNCNYAAAMHRDAGNFGPSFIKAFGDFTGGRLDFWPEDAGGDLKAVPKTEKMTLDLQKNLLMFSGNSAHSVTPFEGSRYSLVFFALGCHPLVNQEDRSKLSKAGFSVPAPDADPFRLLRRPSGYPLKKKVDPTAGKPPAVRIYDTKSLKFSKRKGKSAADVKKAAKARLQPENARSFYSSEARQIRREEAARER